MDYFLTDDQKEIRKLARRIAQEKIMPVRAELDETETFPWEIMRSCAETGLFGVSIPEAYGGLGGGALENCIVVEELSRALPRRVGELRGQSARFLSDTSRRERGAKSAVLAGRGEG